MGGTVRNEITTETKKAPPGGSAFKIKMNFQYLSEMLKIEFLSTGNDPVYTALPVSHRCKRPVPVSVW